MRKINGLDFILLVDDDEATNYLNQRVIRKADINTEVQVAGNGREALEYLTNTGKFSSAHTLPQAGLIFLDINMPGMNGWEFLEAYKELPEDQTRRIKILMLTTSINPDEERKAIDIPQVKGFIHKPLTAEKLEKAINVYVF
ncbi:response regulator [Adhaeribacter sp. BT258]|uniref:Response regulator n=1 Tax=Adhaeribacter terrigena TaxID=2793070 RepID=A0ABS1C2C3_9BACT|nr:response regulator [Adhaeribacter terrigena]MBK0403463.1 response regulator [Adhaeribacter terrigena]